jgi:hypothetical protein
MQELIRIIIGIFILSLGIPIGNYLSKITGEELKDGQGWFKIIIVLCLIGAIFFLFSRNDSMLFGLLFIAIVTSRSIISDN